MRLGEYLNVSKLQTHIDGRVVNVQSHPSAPLQIYNYGQKAQFDGIWDDVTCKTRGLIVNKDTQEIVGRPFEKFFNLGHSGRPETDWLNLPAALPEITEKLDGSLGILYRKGSKAAIATRGSFVSDQASWASYWYDKNLPNAEWPDGWTPLFEIVYPDNRVVVKYEWEGLALLSLVNLETGEEMRHDSLTYIGNENGCRVVPLLQRSLLDCREDTRDNFEGYVATWHRAGAPPLKIKIKLLEYCRLHRLLTTISPKEIWRMMKDGESFDFLLEDTPEHYKSWVNTWRTDLHADYCAAEKYAKDIWDRCPLPKNAEEHESRKALAQFFTTGEHKIVSAVLFRMLDGLPYQENIWKLVQSTTQGKRPFRREDG